jgi:hemolysin activation/secretion protein
VNFGYDEVTHRFNLPPLTGSPELVVYASRSTTDTGSQYGPVTTIGTNTATLSVTSQDAQRNPTTTADVGAKFIVPLAQWQGVQSSVSAGFDFKSYRIQALGTNFTTVQEFDTNQPPNLILSQTVPLAQYSDHSITYLPLSLGWSGSRADTRGSTSFGLNGSLFLSALSSSENRIQTVAGSTKAGGNFAAINLNLSREQKLPGDWSLLWRANGQWANEPLISNEQFGLGGTGGVRGYHEGEAYGDTGWRTLFDVRAPAVAVGSFPYGNEAIPANVRCSWFMDYGETYHLDANAGATVREWGTGLGVYYNAGTRFDARLSLAWALRDALLSRAGAAQAYFSVGIQF